MNHTLLLICLIILILVSAFFSSSETGMLSLNRYRLRHLARKGHRGAQRVSELLEHPDRILSVVLIGNTFATILASATATVIAVEYFGAAGVLVATVVMTLVILIVSEIIPKTIAVIHPERVAYISAIPLKILLKIFYPFIWLINGLVSSVLRTIGIPVKKRLVEPLTVEELRTIVHEASGKISSSYQLILTQILDLEKTTVEDVMVSRYEISGIDLSDSWDRISEQLTTASYSHLPLYDENIADVVGMLNMRKVLSVMQQQKLDKNLLKKLADDVYYIPTGAQLNRQLLNFHEQRQNIGLVVDEYGDIQGLLSIADVLAEIVGAVAGNLEDVAQLVHKQKDGSVLVDGRINLRDLNRLLGWKLPVDGPKTLSGLIIETLEMIPEAGIALRLGGYPMEIKETSGTTIRMIQVWPDLYRES